MIQLIHRFSFAICIASSMLMLCSGIAVHAQEILLPSETVVSEDSAPQSAATSSPGYWIVGSQGSPQSFDTSAPVFCPTVTRYDHCSGFRRANMQELTDSLQPGVPVSVFCHGSFVSWQDVLEESRDTWKWLHLACPDQPIQMIYFSWPSDRPVFSPVVQLDVNRLGRRAGRNGFYMANMVQQIPSECPICLVGHSHGTRVIASALHLIGGGDVEGFVLRPGPFSQHRLRAVFAASALDHNWMNPNEQYCRALHPVECLLNLQNSCDPALFIYPLRRPCSGGALGFTGFTRKDRKQLAHCGQKIKNLDLTKEIGIGHFWPNYFERPWLARRVRNYLFFCEHSQTP